MANKTYDWEKNNTSARVKAIKDHEAVRAGNRANQTAANAPKKPSTLQTTGMKMLGGSRDFEREKSRRNSSKWDTYRTSRDFLKMSKGKTPEQVTALSKIASQGQTGRETRSTQRSASTDTQRNTMINARFKRDNMSAKARGAQANESQRLSLVDKFGTAKATLERDRFRNDVYNQDFYSDVDGVQRRRSETAHPGKAIAKKLTQFDDPEAEKKYYDSLSDEQVQALQGYRGLQGRMQKAQGSMPLRPAQAGGAITTRKQGYDSWRAGVDGSMSTGASFTDVAARGGNSAAAGASSNQMTVLSDTGKDANGYAEVPTPAAPRPAAPRPAASNQVLQGVANERFAQTLRANIKKQTLAARLKQERDRRSMFLNF